MDHVVQITHALIEVVPEHLECAECGVRFERGAVHPDLYGVNGSFVCLECRYILLYQKYRRLCRMYRILQMAFARIKHAVLNKGSNRWEVVLGICEAYRGKFDVRFD